METTTKSFIIGQTVAWSKDLKKFEGIVKDDFAKDTVKVTCISIDGEKILKILNPKRELLTIKNKKMSDVKKILLKGQLKKLTNKQLTVKIESGELNELELEVVNEILTTRKKDIVVDSPKRMNDINPASKIKEPKVVKKEEVVGSHPVITDKDLVIKDTSPANKTQRKDVLWIDPKLLMVEPDFNTRFEYGAIVELKDSIIENGVTTPLSGYKQGDNFVITAGHRRHLAIVMAINEGVEIARIPFISGRKKSLEERMFETLLSNDSKQLTPLELGETYRRLSTHGFTFAEIARRIGRNAEHISDMVKVAESSKELKTMITDRKVSANLVSKVKKSVKDDEKAEKIIKEKVREKEKEAEKSGEEVKVTPKDLKDVIGKQPDNTEIAGMVDIDEVEEKNIAKPVKEYSKQEVIVLLNKQVEVCRESLPEAFRGELDDVKLVLKS